MKLTELEKDITEVENGYILQQGNTIGKMRIGLAGQIANKWPKVKMDYLNLLKTIEAPIGKISMTKVGNDLYVVTLLAQAQIGHVQRYTNYNALVRAIQDFNWVYLNNSSLDGKFLPIYIPHGLGAGYGRGNWEIIHDLFVYHLPEVIVCKHEK